MDLTRFTIRQAGEALRKRQVSSVELASAYLSAIERENPELNAFLDVYADESLAGARRSDERFSDGTAASPLEGIPVAVKDNILIGGHRATAGSKILERYTAAYDATPIAKLKAAGVIFLGKTNLDEFAMGSSTERSAFGPTKNPRDHSRVPGGSSGGSAAAVAAGLCAAALGSDTGGSIRQPASFCGVVGLKPSYGAVSRSGLIAMASSLDQIGPITRSVGDARILFQAIRGKDPLDSTTVAPMNHAFVPSSGRGESRIVNHGLRVGVPEEFFGKGLDPDVAGVIRAAIKKCEAFGAEIREISLPHSDYALAAYYIIMPAEVSSNLARFDGMRYGQAAEKAGNLLEVYEKTRAEGFGSEVKRRIILGTFTLSAGYYDAYYLKAQRVRRLIRQDFERAFGEVDVIIGPTAPTPAFTFGEKTEDPLQMYLADIYTVAVNLAGLPAISIPAGWVEPFDPATLGLPFDAAQALSGIEGSSGRRQGRREGKKLPVGLQVIAPWFTENALLDFAEKLEAALGFRMAL